MTPMQMFVAQATSAPVRQIENNPIRERILAALEEHPGLTRRELCKAVERSSSRVDISLRDLIQHGQVAVTVERQPSVRSFHRYWTCHDKTLSWRSVRSTDGLCGNDEKGKV